jgi:hypothetical protein
MRSFPPFEGHASSGGHHANPYRHQCSWTDRRHGAVECRRSSPVGPRGLPCRGLCASRNSPRLARRRYTLGRSWQAGLARWRRSMGHPGLGLGTTRLGLGTTRLGMAGSGGRRRRYSVGCCVLRILPAGSLGVEWTPIRHPPRLGLLSEMRLGLIRFCPSSFTWLHRPRRRKTRPATILGPPPPRLTTRTFLLPLATFFLPLGLVASAVRSV